MTQFDELDSQHRNDNLDNYAVTKLKYGHCSEQLTQL